MSVGYSRLMRRRPSARTPGVRGEELLEMGFDAVLLQPGVDAERTLDVEMDLVDGDGERLAFGIGDHPPALFDS